MGVAPLVKLAHQVVQVVEVLALMQGGPGLPAVILEALVLKVVSLLLEMPEAAAVQMRLAVLAMQLMVVVAVLVLLTR